MSTCIYDPEPHPHELPEKHPVGAMVTMTVAEYEELKKTKKDEKAKPEGKEKAKDMGEKGAGFGRAPPRP